MTGWLTQRYVSECDGGYPSQRRTEAAILAATRDLLAQGGVRELTVEGVAALSGVAKTTIYRRWRSRDELALAVLIDMVQTAAPVARPGRHPFRTDRPRKGAVRVLGKTLMGTVMQGLVSDLAPTQNSPAPSGSGWWRCGMHEVEQVLQRGIERGDLRPDIDIGLTQEMLFGPVYYRLLLSGAPLDRGLAERIVDACCLRS